MKTTIFEQCTTIRCDITELYAFHLDTNNIRSITPPDTTIEILEIDPPLQQGSTVKLRATKFLIPQIWEVEIEKAVPHTLVVDRAIRSPFAFWRHEHRFHALSKSEVQMCDHVEFALPFGFLGSLALPLIRADLAKMFAYRHQQTRRLFEGDS